MYSIWYIGIQDTRSKLCVYTCNTLVSLWGLKVEVKCLPRLIYTWSLPDQPDKPQDPSVFTSPALALHACAAMSDPLCRLTTGNDTQVLKLIWQAFYWLSHLPSPRSKLSKNLFGVEGAHATAWHVEARGRLLRACFVLPSCKIQGSNSGCQTWQPVPLLLNHHWANL